MLNFWRIIMEISYFKEFVVLAETKNFWAASERLYISQSSLSKHIKTLEKELGAPLFERTSRRVDLSDFGKIMLPFAQSIAKKQYEYESAAFHFLHGNSEKLSIATIPVIAHYNITDMLIKFQSAYPGIPVTIQEADTIIIREWLFDHKCDLIIYRDSTAYLEHDPDKEFQIAKVPLCEDPLVVVMNPDHPLAGEKQVELPLLAGENFALIHESSMPYTLCMRACRDAGFVPHVLFTSHNLEAILDMVRKGNCVALLFANHVKFPRNNGPESGLPFKVLPVTPEVKTTVCLGYLKNEPLSPAAAHFLNFCSAASLMGSPDTKKG